MHFEKAGCVFHQKNTLKIDTHIALQRDSCFRCFSEKCAMLQAAFIQRSVVDGNIILVCVKL